MPHARHSKRSENTCRSRATPTVGRLTSLDAAAIERPGRAAAFAVGGLDRIGEPLARVFAADLHAIDDDLQRSAVRAASPDPHRRTRPPGRRRAAGQTLFAGAPQCVARWPTRAVRRIGDRCGRVRDRRRRGAVRSAHRHRASLQLVDFRRVVGWRAARPRPPAGRSPAAAACPRGSCAKLPGDDFRRFAHDLAPAVAAERPADAREQQAHVVVDLGRRADRRSRIADAVLLPDRDRRRDAVDAIDVRLLHPLEELPRIGRQRLDVPPLSFGVDRVEGQRRLPRSADAGNDDQLAGRKRDVDILEVVRARAADDEIRGCGSPVGTVSDMPY